MTPDVNVQIMNFPVPGSELVVPNEDGSFTIMINARLSYEDQMKAYAHAMRHITEDDFQKENVQEIEAHAHEMVRAAKSARKIPAKQFEAQLRRLKKERRQLQQALQKREQEIRFLQEIGVTNDNFFDAAERQRLYGGLE